MKTTKIIITIFAVFVSINPFAQTADEIVKSHIDAIGGQANWDKVKSIRMETTMKQQGAEMTIIVTQVDKKEMRQDINVMGMSGYTIVTTKEGWNFMPWQGQTKAEAMTPDDGAYRYICQPFIRQCKGGCSDARTRDGWLRLYRVSQRRRVAPPRSPSASPR